MRISTLLTAAALISATAAAPTAFANPESKAAQRVEALVKSQVEFAATKAADDLTSIPLGTRLHDVRFPAVKDSGDPDHVAIYLDIPDEVVEDPDFTEYSLYLIGSEFVGILGEENLSGYFLYLRDPATGTYIGADEFFPPDPPKSFEYPTDHATIEQAKAQGKTLPDGPAKGAATSLGSAQVSGALTDKTVYINQGHGWFDDFTAVGRWRVQRSNTCDLVEDFSNAEFNNLYVLPMLRNAGAKVQTVRESDHQTNMVVVDNSDTTANSRGRYFETGSWANSSVSGYVHQSQWNGTSINPFNQGAGQNRLAPNLTTGAPTATANWVANIPEDGYYNVYASWAAFSGRADDAQYLVHHSGGVSEVRMNQQIDGYTWNLLGNFYFEAGAPESERMVTLTNNSTSGAVNVSADAVRWGGGMGDVARHTSGTSGRPRWEEDAVNYLQYTGFGWSGDLYQGTDDEAGGWSDRPQYARWEHTGKDGGVEDAVYYAWHTNAFNGSAGTCTGTARGLVTFRHGTATTDSANFQTLMHDKTYNAINQLWFTGETWTVRPKSVTNFGENNQGSLGSTLPGFLYEGLFHDNSPDGIDYNEPEFRYIMARSVQQGMIDWFNSQDGTSRPYPPEAPLDLAVNALPNGDVELSWTAGPTGGFNGAAATGFRIYRSPNGFGFDDGTDVTGTSTTLTLPADGSVEYFRVAALNAGGVSFPTETLAAARGAGSSVLIVNGFDRNQRSLVPEVSITNAGTSILRHDPRDFQAFNYTVEHAEALDGRGLRISSTSNERVANGTVNLGDYDAVFWICGEESTADDTFSSAEQTEVSGYLSGGGKFFVSGAEIGWDLGRSGVSSPSDLSFYNNVLRTSYVSDDANTYTVVPVGGGPFASVGTINFSPASGARYDAEWPDRLGTSGGSVAALTYSGGAGGTAAVHYESGSTEVISLGFPFEVITSDAVKTSMMDAVFTEFGLTGTPPSDVGDWLVID